MDPNSTNPSSDTQQQDTTQPPEEIQTNQVLPQPNEIPQDDQNSMPIINTDQGQTAIQPNSDNTQQEKSYVESVGESLLDLMDEVSSDDNLIQVVANEMKLDAVKVKSILRSLLDKIDNEQVTVEELAFIMAVTVVDELPEKK